MTSPTILWPIHLLSQALLKAALLVWRWNSMSRFLLQLSCAEALSLEQSTRHLQSRMNFKWQQDAFCTALDSFHSMQWPTHTIQICEYLMSRKSIGVSLDILCDIELHEVLLASSWFRILCHPRIQQQKCRSIQIRQRNTYSSRGMCQSLLFVSITSMDLCWCQAYWTRPSWISVTSKMAFTF